MRLLPRAHKQVCKSPELSDLLVAFPCATVVVWALSSLVAWDLCKQVRSEEWLGRMHQSRAVGIHASVSAPQTCSFTVNLVRNHATGSRLSYPLPKQHLSESKACFFNKKIDAFRVEA